MPTFYTAQGSAPTGIGNGDGYLKDWIAFEKGLTPPPFHLKHDTANGIIQVIFEKDTPISKCVCTIKCVYEEVTIGPFCPEETDYITTFTEQTFLETDPTVLLFSFTDSLGNATSFEVNSLVRVVPVVPTLSSEGSTIYVGVSAVTTGFTDVSDIATQLQVEKYVGNPTNTTTLMDWADIPIPTIADRRAIPGVLHGYRVRMRSATDNPSQWSAWSTITP